MYEPEMGQFMFGTKWEARGCPSYILTGINWINDALSSKFGEDFYISNNGLVYWNYTFIIQAYYWGECKCGYDEAEIAWEESHKHSPICFHTQYRNFINNYGDFFAPKNMSKKEWEKRYEDFKSKHGLPKGKDGDYGIAIRCTCDYHKKWDSWSATHSHAENCFIVRPNFWHFDSDTRTHWYKYPGRGMSINRKTSREFWFKIIKECINSIENDSRTRKEIIILNEKYWK